MYNKDIAINYSTPLISKNQTPDLPKSSSLSLEVLAPDRYAAFQPEVLPFRRKMWYNHSGYLYSENFKNFLRHGLSVFLYIYDTIRS